MKKNQMGLYEPEIGKSYEIWGLRVKCVFGKHRRGCAGCALWTSGGCARIACFAAERDDKKDCYFKIS